MASLQFAIAKILARVGSHHWNFSRCGYKGITLVVIRESLRVFEYSVCRNTFQCLFAGKSYLPQLDLLLDFYSELV